MRTFSKEKNPFNKPITQQTQRNLTYDKHQDLDSDRTDQEKYQRVGKYKICLEDLLGKGYSSKVYKGVEDGKQLKKYAVKVIELKNFSPTCLKLFQTEIEIHRSLNHDHVVRCFDIIKTSTHIYMIMEYCPHGDLASYIKQKKKISENTLIDIMTQIVEGYKYLIKEGILHRDLKPANILRMGKIWKISDFGFSIKSKCLFDEVNVGTPLYMPLESLSRSYYSVKTDIFALGIILFELLHGRTPWECKSEKQLMKKLGSQKLIIEKEIKNAKIKQFILKSCNLDEDNRLSRSELEKFDFHNDSPEDAKKSLSTCVSSRNIFFHHKAYNFDLNSPKDQGQYIKNNSQILLHDLQHCRFVYYMIQNIDSFLLQENEKTTFLMVLLKYLLKVVKCLANPKINAQRLAHFDEYKITKNFIEIQRDIDDYTARYEKTYLDYIKTVDIKTIRLVNSKFPEFAQAGTLLNTQFYTNLRNSLVYWLRENNHLLSQLMNQDGQEDSLSEKIQAFQSLFLFYKQADSMAKGQTFKQGLKVVTNYGESKLQKLDYLNIRKEIKHI